MAGNCGGRTAPTLRLPLRTFLLASTKWSKPASSPFLIIHYIDYLSRGSLTILEGILRHAICCRELTQVVGTKGLAARGAGRDRPKSLPHKGLRQCCPNKKGAGDATAPTPHTKGPLQRSYTLGKRKRTDLAVSFLNSNTSTTWACVRCQFDTLYTTQDIAVAMDRIENVDFSLITLEIKIVDH